MRLLVTADLHFNHARGRELAGEVIGRINRAGGDVLLVAGDTAVADGDHLERCLELFEFRGPKLFLCGNHELWTLRGDSYGVFKEELPRRVRAMGWVWLEEAPFIAGDVGIVGTVGWYDYAYAASSLGIPRRFYQAKLSPGAAAYLGRDDLQPAGDDVPFAVRELVARWNDGRFVRLGRSDEAFLDECMASLEGQLEAVKGVRQVVAATHHVPFTELLPQAHRPQLEFAKAYLGSPRLGDLLLAYPNVSRVFCGHSHFPMESQIGGVTAVNIGSSYREKRFVAVDLNG